MKVSITIVSILFLQIISHKGAGQNNEIKFNQVLGNNGKPLGKINAIAQDPHGYMWFASQGDKCIYRYDGNRMIAFRQDQSDSNSLGITNIETLYADDEGMIWIGGAGLDQYNPKTGIFKHYRNAVNDPGSLISKSVNTIAKDGQGRLWVGTPDGLDRLDEKTGKFIHYRNEPGNEKSLSSSYIWRLYKDRQGVLWVGTGDPWFKIDPEDGGLNRLNGDGSFTRYMHDPDNPHSLINNKIAAIYEDNAGNFWVGTSGDGLHTMDRKTGFFVRHLYNPKASDQLSRPPLKPGAVNDKITFISGDSTRGIWIGTMYSGINRYDAELKKITHYRGSNGFPDSTSWHAYTSRDGVVWITTESANLYRTDPFFKRLNSTVTGNQPYSFLEDQEKNLWIGTDNGGLLQYDRYGKLLHQFKHDPADPRSLFDTTNGILSMAGDKGDTIWIGTHAGPGFFNKATNQFFKLPVEIKYTDAPFRNVPDVMKDKQGLIWFVINNHGLLRYNPVNNSFKQFIHDEKDSTSLNSNYIVCIYEDRQGIIWVGDLGGGVNRLYPETGTFRHYLKKVDVSELFEDSRGTFWVGTDHGLYTYNREADTFSAFFDPNSEMSTANIFCIREDSANNLWMHNWSSIMRLNPDTKETFIYADKFGITPYSLHPLAFYKNHKGQLLAGNLNGFYQFYPAELAVKADFKIIITDLFINSVAILPGKASVVQEPVEEINDVVLRYNQNNIAFNFAAIDYRNPEIIQYFTMLENYDNTWRAARGDKSSYYFNVPPGKYVYRVKAFNSDGTKAEKQITIHIHPPWWQTWWFRSLAILFSAALLYVFVQYRSRSLKQRNILLEKKVTERTNELNNSLAELKTTQDQLIQSEKMASLGELTSGIAHEIKNPLNFINNFSELNMELIAEIEEEQISILEEANKAELTSLVKTLRKNSEKINHHGKRIDEIVKGMLQHSRLGNINKELVNINALCDESLKLAYHGFRAKEKTFNASFETRFDPGIPQIKVIPQDIGRVLLNLINNAFYTVNEKKKKSQPDSTDALETESLYKPAIIVSTKKSENKIFITISDNGMGIPPAIINKIFQPFFTTKPTGEGTGLGLSMSYDIISKGHGGELRAKSKEGLGTDFEIVLPI